jgi:hypothetical protein
MRDKPSAADPYPAYPAYPAPPTAVTRRQPPARPRLAAEYRLRVTLPSGDTFVATVASQAEAVRLGRRMGHSTWAVERRYVGQWMPVTPQLRSAIIEASKAPRREVDPPEVVADTATTSEPDGAVPAEGGH